MLHGKRILLGISGSIAAYKSVFLTRLLKKQGAEVRVVLTESAQNFVTPASLATLSENEVLSDFYADKSTGQWNNHVELGLWADVMLIAPATAKTLSACAHGFCDNLLTAVYLSAKCPVIFAPAMDLDMYAHPSTKKNLNTLASYGNYILEAKEGELASGLSGKGRMQEPEEILRFLESFFESNKRLKGKKVLITAGPTYEEIDPVRFIGNHSSGKMGSALAAVCTAYGAEVTFVHGPMNESLIPSKGVVKGIRSAEEMLSVLLQQVENHQILIMAAAVADYRPKEKASQKIKKADEKQVLELVKNPDILKELSSVKTANQLFVGFALETENEEQNALEKLARKNLDFLVLNSLADQGAGFGHDTNKITLLHKYGRKEKFSLKSKQEVAKDIVNAICTYVS